MKQVLFPVTISGVIQLHSIIDPLWGHALIALDFPLSAVAVFYMFYMVKTWYLIIF